MMTAGLAAPPPQRHRGQRRDQKSPRLSRGMITPGFGWAGSIARPLLSVPMVWLRTATKLPAIIQCLARFVRYACLAMRSRVRPWSCRALCSVGCREPDVFAERSCESSSALVCVPCGGYRPASRRSPLPLLVRVALKPSASTASATVSR